MSEEEKPERLVCLLHGCMKRTCVLCDKDAEIDSLRSRLSAGGGQTIEDLREVAAALSGALQLASKENDTLKRQVEVLAKRIDTLTTRYGECRMCPVSRDGYHSPPRCECGQKCAENMIEWSLEQAKKGQP